MNCKDCIHNEVCYMQEVCNDIEEQIKELGCMDFIARSDVQEIKHGKWQITEYDYYDCSVCGNSYYNGCESSAEARQRLDERPYDVYKYCPNCGAKMDGGAK